MESKMSSLGFSTINKIERGCVINEKLSIHMAVFSKMCNKIHRTKQNKNCIIEMNAYTCIIHSFL
jgi:citrate lyase synthetase